MVANKINTARTPSKSRGRKLRSTTPGKRAKPPRISIAKKLTGKRLWSAYSYYRKHHPELWPRDYQLEYKHYDAKRKHLTMQRIKLRKRFMKLGLVRVGDGKQIHHKNGDPTDSRMANLEILTHCQHRKREGRKCHVTAVKYSRK